MTDVLDAVPAAADSDQPRVRFYELTGVPHMRPADLGTEEVEQLPAEIGKGNDPTCMHLYEQEPENVLAAALLDDMDAWVRSGVPMPRADRVVRRGTSVVRDPQTHNLIGGVRPPWVQVPVAAYMTDAETNCGLLYDTKIVYTAGELNALYGTYDNYVRRFDAAKRASIEARYLLSADAAAVRPIAAPEDFGAAAAPPVCKPSEYAADTYAPRPAFDGQTRAPTPASHVSYKVETIAEGLAHPWSLAFLPVGRMLVTEKTGRLRIISRSGVLSPPLEGVPTLAKFPDGDGGVHDVLLDPQFATNRTLYFTTYEIVPGQVIEPNNPDQPLKGFGRVMRARLSNDERRLEQLHTIYEGIGGTRRLALAPDGTLLTTTFAIDEAPAQKLDSNASKVLRIHTDRSIPKDNPWVGKEGVRPEIYALGIRDSEGLTFDRSTGVLWEIEHGPRGGDELNVIRAGRNYGYPIISYGRRYSGESINGDLTAKRGLEQPVYFWTPDIAPSGLLIYRGAMFPEWNGDVFIGALAAKRLVRLQMKNSRVAAEESLLAERCQRVRDVREGPEGAIYLLVDSDDGQILRLVRGF
jgi:glucose/arabinose dehydrogenase